MSRDYISDPSEDVAFSLRRISSTLDDILEALTKDAIEEGTTTECPLFGAHEHVFRGPHRFHEWELLP